MKLRAWAKDFRTKAVSLKQDGYRLREPQAGLSQNKVTSHGPLEGLWYTAHITKDSASSSVRHEGPSALL